METDLSKHAITARAYRLIAAGLLGVCVAGCQELGPIPAPDAAAATPPTLEEPGDIKYFRSDEPLRLANQHFNEGSYGLAARYYRDAVEKAPKDVAAWIGLAASYDRLARFDLADRAYNSARRLSGETIQILNNEGYSYMLRGELAKARSKFQAALRRDPGNHTIINNLQLLDSSSRYIERPRV